jgi:hypothetical protein
LSRLFGYKEKGRRRNERDGSRCVTREGESRNFSAEFEFADLFEAFRPIPYLVLLLHANMTSFIVNAHLNRELPESWRLEEKKAHDPSQTPDSSGPPVAAAQSRHAETATAEPSASTSARPPDNPKCPFCRIVLSSMKAHKVYEDEHVVAFLDILPLRRGHTLVVPKWHVARLSDLGRRTENPSSQDGFDSWDISASLGRAVAKVSHALVEALGLETNGLNVVCNEVYAQAVPHVRYFPGTYTLLTLPLGSLSHYPCAFIRCCAVVAASGGRGKDVFDCRDA